MTTELGRDGDGFTASVKEFVYDCQKFTIELLKGELLKISGDFANAKLNVYSSTGKLMGGRTDTGRAEFIFEAPESDKYCLIYFQNDFLAKQSRFEYGISPGME